MLVAGTLLIAPSHLAAQVPAPLDVEPSPLVELSSGHVDIGPRLLAGTWRGMVRDDSVVPPVWRDPSEVVLRVGDAASVEVPDDPAYSFLGVAPGTHVHVLPQTQDPALVWIGWNTQDPEVVSSVARGVTLRLVEVVGPGDLVVYLQAGNFAEPDVLWDSTGHDDRSMWLDADTHGHANWVFTRAGAHLVRFELSAELDDGSEVSDLVDLHVAVGDDISNAETLALEGTRQRDDGPAPTQSGDVSGAGAVLVIVAGAGALTAVVATLALHGRRTKRAATTGPRS